MSTPKKVVVLGGGRVGHYIAERLYQRGSTDSVTLVDGREITPPKGVSRYWSEINPDVKGNQGFSVGSVIGEADLVINALPGKIGYRVLKRVIEAGRDCIDISFMPEDPTELHGLAVDNRVTAIVDMGVAPGLCGVFVGHEYYNAFVSTESAVITVGGLPAFPQDDYYAAFSPADVIEEYMRPARIRRHYKNLTLPALSEIKPFTAFDTFCEIGYESFLTDGLRTLLNLSIPNMEEHTLRYEGHAQRMLALRKQGFFDKENLALTSKILESVWRQPKELFEKTIMHIAMYGLNKAGLPAKSTLELVDHTQRDKDHNVVATSMARTTGMPAVAMAEMLIKKDYDTISFGVLTPEEIGRNGGFTQYIYNRLVEEGIDFTIEHADI